MYIFLCMYVYILTILRADKTLLATDAVSRDLRELSSKNLLREPRYSAFAWCMHKLKIPFIGLAVTWGVLTLFRKLVILSPDVYLNTLLSNFVKIYFRKILLPVEGEDLLGSCLVASQIIHTLKKRRRYLLRVGQRWIFLFVTIDGKIHFKL